MNEIKHYRNKTTKQIERNNTDSSLIPVLYHLPLTEYYLLSEEQYRPKDKKDDNQYF